MPHPFFFENYHLAFAFLDRHISFRKRIERFLALYAFWLQ